MSWFGRSASTAAAAPASKAPPPVKVPQGKPVLLIGFNEASRTWEVNPDAVKLLERVPEPLCTVAVCGRARQGKSFLLNTMLGRLTGQELPKGFEVSPTQHSCTRGLWMWSVPIPSTDANGRPCNVLLVDCEGVDAVDQGQKHSAQVFSLAVLLSSVFVYNQLGAIDAVALERLAMVCELAKRIKERSTTSGRGGGQADFHPAFVWLLRDFQLQLAGAGGGRGGKGGISAGQYLEEVLADVRGGGGADEDNRNQMRATIRAVFPDRDAHTLLRPMLLEEDLNRLDKITFSQLRPEFQKGVGDLMALLHSKEQPLQFAGTMVSGRVYAQLAGAYVTALNEGAVPQLVTAWQGVARAETQRAYDAALASFTGAFREEGIADEAELLDSYQAALSGAVKLFKESALGDPQLVGEHEERLRRVADERFSAARTKLRAASEAAAEALLSAERAKLRSMMEGPGASLDAIEAELQRFLAEYDRAVQGPWKYRRASEFLVNTAIGGIKGVVGRIIGERDGALRKVAEGEAHIAQLRVEAGRAAEAEGRASGLARDLAAAREQLARAEGQVASKGGELREAQAEVARLSAQVSQLEEAGRRLQADLAAARSEGSRAAAALGAAQRAGAEAAALREQLVAAQAVGDKAKLEAVSAEGRAASLEARLSAAEAAGRDAGALRAQLAEAEAAAVGARDAAARAERALDEERAVASSKLKEVTDLTAQLLREREAHTATREALAAAQQQQQQQQHFDSTPARARPPSPWSESPGPSPAVVAGDVARARAALPADVSSLTLAELKGWVTEHMLEDEEFMGLAAKSKTRKADWVAYVKRRAGLPA